MVKLVFAIVSVFTALAVGGSGGAQAFGLRAGDGLPSYCDAYYHGSPASSFSYFFVGDGVVVGRLLTFNPSRGWCGYPVDPRERRFLTGFSRQDIALRQGSRSPRR